MPLCTAVPATQQFRPKGTITHLAGHELAHQACIYDMSAYFRGVPGPWQCTAHVPVAHWCGTITVRSLLLEGAAAPSKSNVHSAEPGGGCHLSQGGPSVGTRPALELIFTLYSTVPLSGKQAAAPSANQHACCERFRPWWRELQRFLAAWHTQGLKPATIPRATS